MPIDGANDGANDVYENFRTSLGLRWFPYFPFRGFPHRTLQLEWYIRPTSLSLPPSPGF
jgi:hypothetical protein